jgi:hypothetical protein
VCRCCGVSHPGRAPNVVGTSWNAAGSIAPMTRAWVRKVSAWMLALICYKPAAAAVYAAAFTMIGSGGSPRTALMGFAMLALSAVMLPALMKFFTWTTGSIAGGGIGGQILGAAALTGQLVATPGTTPRSWGQVLCVT